VKRLGDEHTARERQYPDGKPKDRERRVADYENATRAYRQLVAVLRTQGLNEDADRFAYRARMLARKMLWLQRHFFRWLWQSFLSMLAGYGYRPLNTVGWYVLLLVLSTLIYAWQNYAALHVCPTACSPQVLGQALWDQPGVLGQAFVQAITALHGRGFFPQPHATGWEMGTAALDAVAGLLIEATFVATFVQRFFAR